MSIEPQPNLPLSNYPAHKGLTPAQTALIISLACSISSCEPKHEFEREEPIPLPGVLPIESDENQQPDPANDPSQYDATDNQTLPIPGQSIRVRKPGEAIAVLDSFENTANEEKTTDEISNPAELQQRQREQIIRDLSEIQQQLEKRRKRESQMEQAEPS